MNAISSVTFFLPASTSETVPNQSTVPSVSSRNKSNGAITNNTPASFLFISGRTNKSLESEIRAFKDGEMERTYDMIEIIRCELYILERAWAQKGRRIPPALFVPAYF